MLDAEVLIISLPANQVLAVSFPYTAPVGTQRNVVTLRLRAGVFIETGSVQIAILDGQSLLRCERHLMVRALHKTPFNGARTT